MRKYILLYVQMLIGSICIAQTVYTPNGSQVPSNALFTYDEDDYSNCELQDGQDAISNGLFGSSCVVISGYSRQYNCHGYAWHVSTGGFQIAIRQPNGYEGVTPYVSGNSPSYVQTSYNNQGKLRVRYSGDHSAVTTYYPGLYLSKWGSNALVRHSANDVPYDYGSPSTYWTCNYTPPLYGVYLDNYQVSNNYAMPVSWGSHNFYVLYGLDPDTNPYYQSTSWSTTIDSQNGHSANFTFTGNNHGGLSVSLCGTYRYSYLFFKPNGARIAVYPNPAVDETTVELKSSDEEQNIVPVLDAEKSDVKITELILFDENNNVKKTYQMPSENENKGAIKFERNMRGTFYLKALFSDGTSQTKRLVIGQ
jgi:hypothetical protein